GPVEVGIVVEELGRAVAPVPYLATVGQFVPLVVEAGSAFRLTDGGAATRAGTLALAEGGRWSADGVRTTARPAGPGGWVLDGVKSHVLDGATALELAVVARAAAGGALGVYA